MKIFVMLNNTKYVLVFALINTFLEIVLRKNYSSKNPMSIPGKTNQIVGVEKLSYFIFECFAEERKINSLSVKVI